MIKLLLLNLNEQGNVIDTTDCGHFRSYADIGKRLHYKGKPGKYYALPLSLASIAAIKEIIVTKDKFGKRVEMDGSLY